MTRNYLRFVLAAVCIFISMTGISLYGQYCLPTVHNHDVARISQIKLDGKRYVSHGTHGYNNHHSIKIPLTAGELYPITLSPSYLSTQSTIYWKIWIDYNMDGDFNDLYEYACYGKGVGNISGQLRIPKDVWNGETTIRVAISSDAYPTAPCDNVSTGEVEDYTVVITQGTQTKPKDMLRGGLCVHMPNHIDKVTEATITQVTKTKSDTKTQKLVIKEKPIIHYNVSIAPNPSFNESEVKLLLEKEIVDFDRMIVRDFQGKIVLDQLNSNNKLITSNLAGGIYTVTIIKDGVSYSEKVIVAK